MANRNPLLVISDTETQFIGDAHFGRVFKNNVALTRRGEYESLQMQTFVDLLKSPTKLKIQSGDLLDKPVVSNSVLVALISELRDFEVNGTGALYIISGNHDDSKSSSEPTSWDILAEFFANSQKVFFVKTWKLIEAANQELILLVGWNIHQSMAEALIEAKDRLNTTAIKTVVCHLDKISYGNDDNVIPYEFLKDHGVTTVISGHEHKPYHFTEGSLEVIGTGSLLPFSHAEDELSRYYQTVSLDEIKTMDIDEIKNKHIRIRVSEEEYSEALELDLDCLSLQVQKVVSTVNPEDVEQTEVIIENFSATAIWKQTIEDVNLLTKDDAEHLWYRIQEKGIEDEG